MEFIHTLGVGKTISRSTIFGFEAVKSHESRNAGNLYALAVSMAVEQVAIVDFVAAADRSVRPGLTLLRDREVEKVAEQLRQTGVVAVEGLLDGNEDRVVTMEVYKDLSGIYFAHNGVDVIGFRDQPNRDIRGKVLDITEVDDATFEQVNRYLEEINKRVEWEKPEVYQHSAAMHCFTDNVLSPDQNELFAHAFAAEVN